MVKSCIFLLILFSHKSLYGNDHPQAVAAASWFEEFYQKSSGNLNILPFHRLAFIQNVDSGDIDFWPFDKSEFEERSFFEIIDSKEAGFQELLNTRPNKKYSYDPDYKSTEEFFNNLFTTTFVDTIIYGEESAQKWLVYQRDEDNNSVKLIEETSPETKDSVALRGWIIKQIGYHGIVVDIKDDYLLVFSYAPLNPGGDAMLIKNSHVLKQIKKNNNRASAILKLVDEYMGALVFKVVIRGDEDPVIGSKLAY